MVSKLYKCTVCKKKKQPNDFYLRKNGGVGEYKCKCCLIVKRKQHCKENYEQVRKCNRKAVSEWQKRNRAHGAAKTNKYNAAKRNRLPKWVTEEEISKIRSLYKKARQISKVTGTRHEVDHIVPLNGKEVSGLHTIYNLQIITKDENLKKSNQLFEDIVCTVGKPTELE